ncbi:hypothetical protein Q5H94_01950 [Sphingomonas sp. CA1-15]|uniref:Uncharacterized protein n=1 Tax=Sphingomonas immobilis TaxID=3063997 RepID=A0ABT8ZU27_9SPHN|nr:hypothetical protein [Sphingomonas sp. CA1-15]
MIAAYAERIELQQKIVREGAMIARADTKRPDFGKQSAIQQDQSKAEIVSALNAWAAATKHRGSSAAH